ncbi:hypothetical protein SUGI_1042610 [Cryptomeria japonica]|uniref:uncharacterized protein LOC131038491 n=1 Tax=Cryptomeria japonica TaxID=3369 RepID=UPI002414BD89|nr:uncharacterized protein LOC131038491 [Cryptomeria japonica]GLJ49324.1 hypothetical protein SUGI_1042610 [Cryptomeria japonica]
MGKPYEGASLHSQAADFPPSLVRDSPPATPQNDDDDDNNQQTNWEWESVSGLEQQQRKSLGKLSTRGVYWKNPTQNACGCALLLLFHGGDVDADGNCLFAAFQKAMRMNPNVTATDLRRKTVARFLHAYESATPQEKEEIDRTIKNLYSPRLDAGWGVHLVQEHKLLAPKRDRYGLNASIQQLLQLSFVRETAAECIYKERCIVVEDGLSWGKYMSICGSSDDEYDIITLQYTEEGLLSVDENSQGRAAAFGDDIAIYTLATEFNREIFVVQAHGSDGMIEDDDSCLFFLPHRPRSEIFHPPVFLFMKGTGWCGAGADHYEPLLAYPAPVISQEKAAFVL